MALTLAESAKRFTNPLEKGIIQLYAKNSPVLQYLPFRDIKGNTYTRKIEKTLSGVGTRAINADYTDSTSEIDKISAQLIMCGGMAKIDRYQIITEGPDGNVVAEEIESKVKAAAMYFTRMFFKGDVGTDPNSFDGLEKRIDASMVMDMGSSDGGDELTLDKIDELLDAVGVDGSTVLYCNAALRRKINRLMRAQGQAFEMVNNQFGQLIPYYGGVPIGVIGVDNTFAEILDFDEPDLDNGDKAVCSSIYAVRHGVDGVTGIQASNIIVDDQGFVGNSRQIVFDWFINFLIQHPKSAARLRGIKNA